MLLQLVCSVCKGRDLPAMARMQVHKQKAAQPAEHLIL
jgi:hypothetical protein